VRRAGSSEVSHQDPQSDAGQIVAQLSARLSVTPNYDFEALAEFLAMEDNRNIRLLSRKQIAGGWARVRSYTQELGITNSVEEMDAFAALDNSYGIDVNGFRNRQNEGHVRPVVGLTDTTAANLRPLEGIKGAITILG
jgi:hypothetical protein